MANASEWMGTHSDAFSADTPVPCPLCGAKAERVLACNAQRALRKCSGCGVAFVCPAPQHTAIANRFRDEAKPHFDPEPNRKALMARVANYIEERKASGTILDIGCATGLFLSEFFASSRWMKLGVELLESSRRMAESRGIQVFRGDVRHTPFSDNSVDVISSLDSFYYFAEPQFELAEFRRLLKADGILVLEMPVATSRFLRLSRVAGERLSAVKGTLFEESDHLYYHTPHSLVPLVERNGFRVVDVVMLPPNRQTGWVRDFLYRWYWHSSQALRILSAGRIFLGPRFLIAARKCT